MAIAAKDQTRILFYLGWPGLAIVPDSTHYSNVLADRLTMAGSNSEICRIMRRLLAKLENFDECLEKAKCRLAASAIGDIKTNDREIEMLLKERKRCIRELSNLLDVPIMNGVGGGVTTRVCN